MAWISPLRWQTSSGASRAGYQVNWIESGKRRKKNFSGAGARERARDFRADREREERARRDAPAQAAAPAIPAITVDELGRNWVKAVKLRGRERTTWEAYEQHLHDHIGPAEISRQGAVTRFGAVAAPELTGPDCEAFAGAMLAKLSPATAQKVVGSLRMLLRHGVRSGAVAVNAAAATRITIPGRHREEVAIPTPEELREMLALAHTDEPGPPTFGEVWLSLGLALGWRPSEARGAAIEDLVLDGSKPGIHIRRRADEFGRLGSTKTKRSRRFLPLPPRALALIRRWLLVVPRGRGAPDPESEGRTLTLLLPTSIGTIQTLANIYNRVWAPLCRRAGLVEASAAAAGKLPKPRYPLNCLRHAYASLAVDGGVQLKKLSVSMGHSSIKVTADINGHLYDRHERDLEVASAIERSLWT